MAMTRVHLLISGLVQGVFFRASACREGQLLGLSGWVRNLPGGEVEAEVEGPEEAVERFIRWCKCGPPGAEVGKVEVTSRTWTGEFGGFSILR